MVLVLSCPAVAPAELIINDAVFAHDFESISGDTITALKAERTEVDYTSISEQTYNWFLIEDANGISNISEYFDYGDYDEAALWNRALSATEMSSLYAQGLAPVPEPNSLCLLAIGLTGMGIGRIWRRRLPHRAITVCASLRSRRDADE
ncbi:MAG: PEP-CTERM sorting domain-containing protein [Pirellulaceae bacterium]